MIMAVFMRLVAMRVIMIAVVAMRVVVMFHRVRIPSMLKCLHAPQSRKKTCAPKTVTVVAPPPITMADPTPTPAVAPPNNTAKRSREMARSTVLLPDGRNPRSKAAQDSV